MELMTHPAVPETWENPKPVSLTAYHAVWAKAGWQLVESDTPAIPTPDALVWDTTEEE